MAKYHKKRSYKRKYKRHYKRKYKTRVRKTVKRTIRSMAEKKYIRSVGTIPFSGDNMYSRNVVNVYDIANGT